MSKSTLFTTFSFLLLFTFLIIFNQWHQLHPWIMSISLLVMGILLGATLNYFQFGFSSSFRSLITERKTMGIRAILIMLAFAILLFAPLLAVGQWQDTVYNGYIRPLSLAIPLGAFIFGIGMQISCGCTSGTLNRVGQMQALALPTLLFMVIGGTLASATFGEWRHLPSLAPFAFQKQLSWPLAIVLQLVLLVGLYRFLLWFEQQRHKDIEPIFQLKLHSKLPPRLHPFLQAALALAFFNFVLFLLSGSPWSISSVFPYWGTSLITQLNLPFEWEFWDYAMENQNSLNMALWLQPVSLTTIGVILGALVVSLARPRNKQPFSLLALLVSMVGGVIMGFGAVMASGCNIGAFFSGIASGSLHGWVWFGFALLGNIIGLKLRAQIIRFN